MIIPEKRNFNFKNCYIKKNSDITEYYNKDVFNSDFTRKLEGETVLEDVEKEILLLEIVELLKDSD